MLNNTIETNTKLRNFAEYNNNGIVCYMGEYSERNLADWFLANTSSPCHVT